VTSQMACSNRPSGLSQNRPLGLLRTSRKMCALGSVRTCAEAFEKCARNRPLWLGRPSHLACHKIGHLACRMASHLADFRALEIEPERRSRHVGFRGWRCPLYQPKLCALRVGRPLQGRYRPFGLFAKTSPAGGQAEMYPLRQLSKPAVFANLAIFGFGWRGAALTWAERISLTTGILSEDILDHLKR
jgi:hypothetical protein